jgi:hypothetical protein
VLTQAATIINAIAAPNFAHHITLLPPADSGPRAQSDSELEA